MYSFMYLTPPLLYSTTYSPILHLSHWFNLPATALSILPGLYPNIEELGDYMGLALHSDEVQRNLALVPVADNVSLYIVCVSLHFGKLKWINHCKGPTVHSSLRSCRYLTHY